AAIRQAKTDARASYKAAVERHHANQAATKIQALVRGRLARKAYADLLARGKAAESALQSRVQRMREGIPKAEAEISKRIAGLQALYPFDTGADIILARFQIEAAHALDPFGERAKDSGLRKFPERKDAWL